MEIKNSGWRFIDSHVHLDLAYQFYPDLLRWLKENGCRPVSWAYALQADNLRELKHYLKRQPQTIHEIREKGIPCYFLSGVHPRNIPRGLKPEAVREWLLPALEDEYCLGIGEIGLEKGTEQEKDIFLAQLDLAEEVVGRGKIFGVHTPRENKGPITHELLKLLQPYHAFREKIVIDHCTAKTLPGVLKTGFWAGITLSPIKTSLEEIKEIIQEQSDSLERIMLNTDSGGRFHDDLVRFYQSGQFDPDVRNQLANLSAIRFFGL